MKTKKIDIKKLILESRTLIILIALCIIFAIMKNTFYNPINLLNIVKRSVYISVCAFSTTLMLTQGNLDISLSGTAAMVGCFFAILIQRGVSLPIAIIISIIIGSFGGFLIGLVSIKGKVETFLAALAMKYVFTGVAYLVTGGIPVPIENEAFEHIFGGGSIFGFMPITVLIFIGAFIINWFLYKKTKYGYYLRSIGSNIEAAKVAGINTDWIKIITFIINGAFGALSGLLLAGMFSYGSPSVGAELAMEAIAAVVLGGSSTSGGRGNMWGTVLGVFIMGVINNGLQLMGAGYDMQCIVKGGVIVFACLLDSWVQSRENK